VFSRTPIGSELQREIKPEGLAGRSPNGKLKLFPRVFLLSVDSSGLIGVRQLVVESHLFVEAQ